MLGVTGPGAFVGVNMSFKSVAMVEVSFQVFQGQWKPFENLEAFFFHVRCLICV